ncbi:MAG: hypothetical protein HW407_1220 [Bacteroidetes bacterium]|nr:hypothetical protein [Bacteroidota bacterium]
MSRWMILLAFLWGVHGSLCGQGVANQEFDAKTRRGIDLVYNLEFEKAEQEFGELIRLRPRDPAGHFFHAMVQWWRIIINVDSEEYDDRFMDSLEVVIDLCDELLEQNENDVHALFFKGGSIGFQGRLKFHRNDYLGAANAGRKALPIVQDASTLDPENYDVLLGSGIYNYYAEVVPNQYPFLKPLLLFLPAEKKGIEQLTAAAEKGKYASVETSYFLMQIYYAYEKDYAKALALAERLHQRYPGNILFHKYLGRVYVSLSNWSMVQKTFGEIAARVFKGQRGYNPAAEREAVYYLGLCDMNIKEPSGFMVMTNLKIGMIYDVLSKRELAVRQYQKVLDMKEYLNSYRQAEEFMKKPFMQ